MTDDRSSRQAALVAATLASFLTPFMGSSTNVAMPQIAEAFSMDAVLQGWVPSSYLLAATVFLIPFGRLADLHGRKRIFGQGIIIYTLASLLSGVALSPAFFIVSRVLQGVGSAMIFGTGMAILTSVYPLEERGRVLGINVAAVYVGLSLGPFIGGLLTEHLGWRSIFLANVPLGLIVIGFVMLRLHGEWAEARGETLDVIGSAIYAGALVAVMVGFSRLPDLLGTGLILLGALGLVAFAWWERRARYPVLNLDLFFENRPFALSSLAALIHYCATSAVTFLLSLYLQYVRDLGPQEAGLILIAQPIMQATFSPVAGWLSDKVEPRIVASLGMMMTALGLGLLISVSSATALWTIILRLCLLGFGFALFSSPNMNAIMSSVRKRFYGVASGIAGTMRLIGQTMSLGVVTLLFALYIGRIEITPAVHAQFLASMRTAFAVFTGLCLVGIFASLARGTIREAT
jgi:EmrB/QacA subfamily drug resistance transporter